MSQGLVRSGASALVVAACVFLGGLTLPEPKLTHKFLGTGWPWTLSTQAEIQKPCAHTLTLVQGLFEQLVAGVSWQ